MMFIRRARGLPAVGAPDAVSPVRDDESGERQWQVCIMKYAAAAGNFL